MLQCLTTFSNLWRNAECIPDHALMVIQGQLETLAVDFAIVEVEYIALHICHFHRGAAQFTVQGLAIQKTHLLLGGLHLVWPALHSASLCSEDLQVNMLQNVESHTQWHDYPH